MAIVSEMRLRLAASRLVLPAVLVAVGGPDPSEPDDTEYGLGCTGSPTSSSIPLPNAELFIDPQGFYEMEVDRDWRFFADHDLGEEVEAWAVWEPVSGYPPNVDVMTYEDVGAIDLESFLVLYETSAPALVPDGEFVRRDVVEGSVGELGVVELTFTQEFLGTQQEILGPQEQVHVLGVVAIRDQTVVVAKVTASTETFDEARCQVEPYLLTLRPTEPPG